MRDEATIASCHCLHSRLDKMRFQMLRKQYHFRTIQGDLHAWDVHRLIRLSKHLTPKLVRLEDIAELDENWWYEGQENLPTPRALAAHMALVQQTDLAYPILLCADGRLMDGMHRLVKALLDDRTHIQAIRFPVTPEADYINVSADDLPYPDEEVSKDVMDQHVHIRPLAACDYPAAGRIYFCAVHEGTRNAYSYEQRLAWAGETIDLEQWQTRIEALTGFVAEVGGEPIGFITIDRTGYVDLAFVLPSATGKGIGRVLLDAAEQWAKANGAARLTTEASLIARPFFEKSGWLLLEEEDVLRNGVNLTRYKMQKDLVRDVGTSA
ncbi:GNAT family N-acetyltransferase [Paracoccus methylovorus]|uniref:GNAT family N-acetyltransferase n=2 Tax=Paracoccus TaxID=265 RepID=A0ABX7JGD3_9RHOB|nr:GNAT family N-acetyltransferase [Paracoccus methylovorus]QRZ13300.1 GNAT family N-acetyltransferase [Paracoccus methylovorus]